jgi:hypothetical protein
VFYGKITDNKVRFGAVDVCFARGRSGGRGVASRPELPTTKPFILFSADLESTLHAEPFKPIFSVME